MGLGNPLRTNVALQQPSSFDDAVIFARAYEQHNASRDTVQSPPTQSYNRATTKTAAPTTTAIGVTGATNPVMRSPSTTVVRLTPVEIAQRRKDGKCFHCNDMFVQGHKNQCKQLFVIEVVADDTDGEPRADSAKPTISLHALTGIQPCSGRTMQVYVLINGARLRDLLDSGSTHNTSFQSLIHSLPFQVVYGQEPPSSALSLRAKRAFRQCRLRYMIATSSSLRCGSDSNRHSSSTSTSMTARIRSSPSPSASGFCSA
jgi:hypothetical protein